jgi:hypothetical protein
MVRFLYFAEKTTSVGLWWSGSSQFVYYCFTKPVKSKKPAANDNPDAGWFIKDTPL